MSGAGRKVFEPGAVLTASQVQNYLQDQAVQYYAGTAARGSAIGTATTEGMMSYLADSNRVQVAVGTADWIDVVGIPIANGTAERALITGGIPFVGTTVHRSDLGYQETYYAATGSPSRAAGWYSGQNGGLVPIIPTSVTVGSGSASVSNNGTITLTGVSSFSLNGCFNSNFTNYKFVYNLSSSTSVDNYFRWRISGTDVTTGYYGAGFYNSYTATGFTGGYAANNGTSNWIGATGAIPSYADCHLAIATYSSIQFRSQASYSASNFFGGYNCTTSPNPDGFTMYPGSGTLTGTIEVYGYRK